MARTTHVKKAQQRYETVPVLDEEGKPKKVPVMRGGKQRVTKKGKPIFMTLTVVDKTKPKPLYNCSACGKPIEIGTPYKHISPKSGPYGGHKMTRHESCPGWQVWDYSNSLSAQLSRISYDFGNEIDQAESPDDVTSALSAAAESVKEIAGQKREGAENIESGFGHETSQSAELAEMADSLESWADEIEAADVPEMTDCEECDSGKKDCDNCEGRGETDEGDECPECEAGQVDCDNCDGTGEDVDAWRDEVRDSVTIVDESPV